VSEKWTFQLSRSSTLDSAAAMPPSAMTVCAFPSRHLQTMPTETPAADASIAARRPAPPEPMINTSCSNVWYSGMRFVKSSNKGSAGEAPNSKLQAPEKSQAPNPKAARFTLAVLYCRQGADWSLEFRASLELGAWSLELGQSHGSRFPVSQNRRKSCH